MINNFQWAKIVVVLERGFTKNQLQHWHREYSVKMAGPTGENGTEMEIRALVVIKTSPKTKARQRKIAVGNWKVIISTNLLQFNLRTFNENKMEDYMT